MSNSSILLRKQSDQSKRIRLSYEKKLLANVSKNKQTIKKSAKMNILEHLLIMLTIQI